MKCDFNLMDNLLGGIDNADSHNEMLLKDPAIQAADNTLMEELDKLRGRVPKEVIDRIGEAAVGYANAVGECQLLYGMHVINTMVECARKPSEVSQYILDRVNNRQRAS